MGNEVREKVKQFYGDLARQAGQGKNVSCCSGEACCDSFVTNAKVLYGKDNLSELPKEAISFSLGCANPLVKKCTPILILSKY